MADIVFIEASRGEERSSYADTARDEGRLVVERNHVLVDGDVRLVKSLLNDFAGFAFVSEVDEHKVVVGAAGNEVVTHFVEFVSHCSRVFNDLGHIDFEARIKRFFEADSLCSDDVHERAALHSRENSGVEVFFIFFLRKNETASRTSEGLVGRRSYEIAVRNRAWMKSCSDETGNVSHVNPHDCADFVADFADSLEVDDSRISRCTCKDHSRLVFDSESFHFVIVDPAGFLCNAVGNYVVKFSGEVYRAAVSEVAAVVEVHREDCVTRFAYREVNAHICLRTAVGLDVCAFCSEKLACSLFCEFFDLIYYFAAAVVSLFRITFGIFVGKQRALSLHDCIARKVFTGDKFKTSFLSFCLFFNDCCNFRVNARDVLQIQHFILQKKLKNQKTERV